MKWLLLILICTLLTTGCTKKESSSPKKNISRELNLNYFPENALIIGHVNLDKVFQMGSLKKLLDQIVHASQKASGIDFGSLTTAEIYLSSKDEYKTTDIAAVLNDFDLSKLRSKSKKSENYQGQKLHYIDKTTLFTIIDNHTMIGTINGIKELVALNKSGTQALSKSPRAASFRAITASLKESLLFIAVVPDKVVQAQFKRLAVEKPEYSVIMNDFKAAAFGLSLNSKTLQLKLIIHLSEASALLTKTVAETKLKEISGKVESQIELLFPMIGMGSMVELSIEAFRSIKIEQQKDHLVASMTVSNNLLKMIPQAIAIFQTMSKAQRFKSKK